MDITFDQMIYALIALNVVDALITYYVITKLDAEEANGFLQKIMLKIGTGPALLLKVAAVTYLAYSYLGQPVTDSTRYLTAAVIVLYVGVLLWNLNLARNLRANR